MCEARPIRGPEAAAIGCSPFLRGSCPRGRCWLLMKGQKGAEGPLLGPPGEGDWGDPPEGRTQVSWPQGTALQYVLGLRR